jgi:hypothetical protein
VRGPDDGAIGESDGNARGCRDFLNAMAVGAQEMGGAAGVGTGLGYVWLGVRVGKGFNKIYFINS